MWVRESERERERKRMRRERERDRENEKRERMRRERERERMRRERSYAGWSSHCFERLQRPAQDLHPPFPSALICHRPATKKRLKNA